MDYTIRLMKPEEYNFAYTQKQEIMDDSACIGHLRVDFGSNGQGFFTSWDDHRPELKSPEFKQEFDDVINALRQIGQLGGTLYLQGVKQQPMRVFCTSGIDKLVQIKEEVS